MADDLATSLAGGTPPAPAPQADGGAPPSPPAGDPPTETAPAKPALTDPPAQTEFKFDDLKIPEGIKLEGDLKDGFAKAITEGDPNKRAQALLDLYAADAKKNAEVPFKQYQELNQKWVNEVKSDPEIGGDNWANVAATIAKGLDTFGTPGVRQALNLTGAGNNPDVVKTFYKMAKALTEGGHVGGAPPASTGDKSLAEVMYPTMKGNG